MSAFKKYEKFKFPCGTTIKTYAYHADMPDDGIKVAPRDVLNIVIYNEGYEAGMVSTRGFGEGGDVTEEGECREIEVYVRAENLRALIEYLQRVEGEVETLR